MTQEEVKDYLLAHECHIYDIRVKEDGNYYYIRKNGTKKMVVVYPTKKGVYTEAAICHICEQLEISEIPTFAQDYYRIVVDAKAKMRVLNKFPPRGQN